MAPSDPHEIDQLAAGLRAGDRAQLARAITLIESASCFMRIPAHEHELRDRHGKGHG